MYIILLSVIISSCYQKNRYTEINLKNPIVTHSELIPSASGIEMADGRIYIVGDDSPWLYELGDKLNILNKSQLSNIDSIVNRRVPGNIKADFECIGKLSEKELLVLSSGSLKDRRDTAYLISLPDMEIKSRKNTRAIFERIKTIAKLPKENEINIEGLAITKTDIYMFHRGNVSQNIIIKVNKDHFTNWFIVGNEIPEIEIYKYDLPEYDGIASGFSGACISPDGEGILFTASMEDTSSETADGEILGSYIGYININELQEGKYIYSLLEKDNKPFQTKLEGICYYNIDGKTQIITVVDNDNGTSDIVKLQLLLE